MTNKLLCVIAISLCLVSSNIHADLHPAELTIENKSERKLTIKIMKAGESGKSAKFTETVIEKSGKSVLYFHETGNYYLKTMAEYPERETIYTKGDPFKVYIGNDGYSILTITITILETEKVQNPLSGVPISKDQFEKDKE